MGATIKMILKIKPFCFFIQFTLYLIFLLNNCFSLTRSGIISSAASYINHSWYCYSGNANNTYNNLVAGRSYKGIAYNWGGTESTSQFQTKINNNVIAGDSKIFEASHFDFAGVDCSGYVSQCWGYTSLSEKYSTATLPYISMVLNYEDLEPGDIVNYESSHVRIFEGFTDDGRTYVNESTVGLNISGVVPAGTVRRILSRDNNYTPRRHYNFIELNTKVKTTLGMNLRTTPGGSVIGSISLGATGKIIDGPIYAYSPDDSLHKYIWWNVNFDNGSVGWVVIRYLKFLPNNSPDIPASANQYKSDYLTAIPETTVIAEDDVVLKATLNDSDGDKVRLEIELQKTSEIFTGIPTDGMISNFVASGTRVAILRSNLLNSGYHWQYRAKDSYGAVSDWQEFQGLNNKDFIVDTSPPQVPTLVSPANYSQTISLKPTFDWMDITDISGVKYNLQVANNSNFSSPVVNVINLSTSQYTAATALAVNTTYYWHVQSVDGVANSSSWSAYRNLVIISTEVPDIIAPEPPSNISVSPNSWTNTNSFSINWTNPNNDSGIKTGAWYKIGTEPASNSDGIWQANNPIVIMSSEGIKTIHIWLEDNLGNKSYLNYSTAELYLDQTAPMSSVQSLNQYVNTNSFNINWLGNDATGSQLRSFDVQYKVGSTGTWNDWLTNTELDSSYFGPTLPVLVQDGQTYYFRSRSKDNAENVESYPNTADASITVDTSVPSISVVTSSAHQENTPIANNNPSFTWTASSDSISDILGYSYEVNQIENYDLDLSTETTSTSASFTKSDGIYWFHLRVIDKAGNSSNTVRYKFIIDTTSPFFEITSYDDPASIGNISLNVTANERLKQTPLVSVKQNGQVTSSIITMISSDDIVWIGTYTVVSGYDGLAAINVSGTDIANNISISSGSFVVDTIVPTASISILPTSPLKTGRFDIALTITDTNNTLQTPDLRYTPLNGSSIKISLTGENKTWTGISYIESTTPEGVATFSISIVDSAGNVGTTITSGKTFNIDTTILATVGGTASNSDGTNVNISSGVAQEDINVKISSANVNSTVINQANNNISDDKGIKPIEGQDLYRDITATGDASGNEISEFQKPVTITIPYPDNDQDGIVDGTNTKEENIGMFYLDKVYKTWAIVVNSVVDKLKNIVSANVWHFSTYTLMELSPPQNLSESFGYPNPCYMNKDGYLRISNVPLNSVNTKIFIYNIAGELVKTLKEGEGIEIQTGSKIGRWNGKNENDEKAASGIYIYLIKSDNMKSKTEKIAIFW
ncbi:MAG: hypothetical protein A2539_03035 [Elusimicrobia bacterium RIFOXYD2_FULL_34_15]|nr:MAG: hypothetical protein A2539_03035 [Elusimicrobia bacterium RIFOXYD2_FULL_34_15]